jgi:hypothetical protein
MDVLALVLWAMVAMIALPLGRHALDEHALLGLQAMAGAGGLALFVIFIFADHPSVAAWAATVLGVVGTVALIVVVPWLASDRRPVSPAGQTAEETDALLTAIVLPLYAGAAFFSLLAALNVGIVT